MRKYITVVVRFIDEDTGPSDIQSKVCRALLDSQDMYVGEIRAEATIGKPVLVNPNGYAEAGDRMWPIPVVDGRTHVGRSMRQRES